MHEDVVRLAGMYAERLAAVICDVEHPASVGRGIVEGYFLQFYESVVATGIPVQVATKTDKEVVCKH